MPTEPRAGLGRGIAYWLVAVALTAFGVVAIFSIGAPFFLIGVTLLALGPFRDRPRLFRPALAGVAGFILGYVLVAPLTCTATTTFEVGGESSSFTECSNLLGLDYSGVGIYNPSHGPALVAGAVAAIAAAAGVLFLVTRRSSA